MSYCAFRNVQGDIFELIEYIEEGKIDDISEEEFRSAKELLSEDLDELKSAISRKLDEWEEYLEEEERELSGNR